MDPNTIKIKYTKLFIDNEFVDAVSKKTFPVLNPSTGKHIIDVAEADKADVDKAVEAAKRAFHRNSEWRKMSATQRGVLMFKFADLLEKNMEEIAALESLNNGKPLPLSLSDMQLSIKTIRYFAGWTDKIHGDTIPTDAPCMTMTRKEPVGVVGQIIPWNYPIAMLIWKWGPALATGCTIVMKPAEQTPLTALVLGALIKEAGFPKGVVNLLPGYGPTAGHAVAAHPDIRKVAFTGSTEIGHLIMEASANSNLKRVTLELGGKSPLVICDDVNIDLAVEIAYQAVFYNQGQNCCAGTRTFVQEGIYDEFVKKAAARAKARKVGNPFESGVEQGPQVDQPSLDKIIKLVETGVKEGAKLQAGGKRIGSEGYFFEPTVFSDVTDAMTIAKEEIFGPVQSILKFKTLDEAIDRANQTSYGLASGILTKSLDNVLKFSRYIEAGSVWVNTYMPITPQTPFGGYKKSGFGRDLGKESLECYLETKTISIQLPED